MINIPIYRAKKIDSDEWVEGFFIKIERFIENKNTLSLPQHSLDGNFKWIYHIQAQDKHTTYEIDTKTLSIHFPNMLDKNGKKIFASLQKDGIGGSKCTDSYNEKYVCVFNSITNSCVMSYNTKQLKPETMGVYDRYWQTFEVTGIKE